MAIKRAKIVIAVSQFTKDDIVRQFKIKPDKVVVTYEGVSGLLNKKLGGFSNDKEILLGYNISSPFLLYVGNAYPHKNLEGLVKVFSVIHGKRPNLSLVLVGRQDYFYKRVQEFTEKYWGEKSPVIFPGFVPDENLV